jgi:hypothetical protein
VWGVGRSCSFRNVSNARESISTSLASPTRVTFQPYAMKRVATSSLKASVVEPSIVTGFES